MRPFIKRDDSLFLIGRERSAVIVGAVVVIEIEVFEPDDLMKFDPLRKIPRGILEFQGRQLTHSESDILPRPSERREKVGDRLSGLFATNLARSVRKSWRPALRTLRNQSRAECESSLMVGNSFGKARLTARPHPSAGVAVAPPVHNLSVANRQSALENRRFLTGS